MQNLAINDMKISYNYYMHNMVLELQLLKIEKSEDAEPGMQGKKYQNNCTTLFVLYSVWFILKTIQCHKYNVAWWRYRKRPLDREEFGLRMKTSCLTLLLTLTIPVCYSNSKPSLIY